MCCFFGSNIDGEDDVYFATLKKDKLPIEIKIIGKAKRNDPYALFFIGDEYYRKGLASDAGKTSNWYKKALTWYEKAAKEGYPDAQFNLGYMYENGVGVRREDYNKAIEYYITASTLGYTSAFYRLGYIYENGIGITENKKISFEWYEKAAEQGDIFAQFKIASMYKTGTGVTKNQIMALTWFTRCANQGDRDAQAEVIDLKKQGYSLEEEGFRRSSVRNPRSSGRNNSVHKLHEKQREDERRKATGTRRLSNSKFNPIKNTKTEHEQPKMISMTEQKLSQQSQETQNKNSMPSTSTINQIYFKPNLKDDSSVSQIKNTNTRIRSRASKNFVDYEEEYEKDLNLDEEENFENDIYYDGHSEKGNM